MFLGGKIDVHAASYAKEIRFTCDNVGRIEKIVVDGAEVPEAKWIGIIIDSIRTKLVVEVQPANYGIDFWNGIERSRLAPGQGAKVLADVLLGYGYTSVYWIVESVDNDISLVQINLRAYTPPVEVPEKQPEASGSDDPVSEPEYIPHTHSYSWVMTIEPTAVSDGLEVYTCSCGDTLDRRTLPAADVFLKEFEDAINAGKPGDTVTMELGLRNTLSGSMMEKIAAKRDIDLVFRFTYQNVNYEITIPRGTEIDTSLDWYGPEKLKQLFGFTVLN